MDAIICNAGSATRLNEMGINIKKCLLRDLNTGKSILWYQLDALNEINIKNVFIVVQNNDSLK